MAGTPQITYTSEDWNSIRERFSGSMFEEIELAILAQNAGKNWPFKGSGETAAKYLEFDLEELHSVPGLIGKKSRVNTLIAFLEETLAFDDPFSDLVDKVEADSEIDETFERILTRLDIDLQFPAQFLHFGDATITRLSEEGVATLIDVVRVAQKLDLDSHKFTDLRSFLNGLSNRDETDMAQHMPYRIGAKGLHLVESINLLGRELPQPAKAYALRTAGIEVSEGAGVEVSDHDQAAVELALKQIGERCRHFKEDAKELQAISKDREALERHLIVINNAEEERVSAALIRLHYGVASDKKSGFFGKLLGR